ncbi:LTA synthase family protein [Alloiococcus sp. CFN-8]|uniref:LTA synthase family protein n=1 Tax=Alloiococcus sp. CFN-8 TaxID=3416081 RepID=UPI003CF8B495
MENGKIRKKSLYLLRLIYILISFGILDVWLRVETRWIGRYSIYELAPNLFTLVWCIIIVIILQLISSRLIGRIIYAILYFITVTYVVIQYGYYMIFDKFLFISDFALAGEGAEYLEYVLDIITPWIVFEIVVLVLFGIAGIIFFPKPAKSSIKRTLASIVCIVAGIVCIFFIPILYKSNESVKWNNPAYEYEKFSNSAYDMELTGIYQYVFRDTYLLFVGNLKDYSSIYKDIDGFFINKNNVKENEMTGIFKGKNIIIFMMESMDDWLITEGDTPTIYKMMKEGINFNNLYTPSYASGYTFNTEFAFNTSIYPYSNGNVTYSLIRNSFSESIANKFINAGYRVQSFHSGTATFYNRGSMHEVFGYEVYNSYQDYPEESVSVYDDRFLYISDELYSDLTCNSPFMSYVITYSPHLPYDIDDDLVQYALEKYPEYVEGEVTEENIIRAKARLTDDMFKGLLERLEEDGLLEDTVIIGFADHYSYGLTNQELLQQLSEETGNSILENTPAFVYCAGRDITLEVNKTMQTTDLAPTIENLFGLEVSKEIMGHDIFDERYKGFAIFSDFSWITDEVYVKSGQVMWNNGMTEEEINSMNEYVQDVYKINDAILDSDYYKLINRN